MDIDIGRDLDQKQAAGTSAAESDGPPASDRSIESHSAMASTIHDAVGKSEDFDGGVSAAHGFAESLSRGD